MKTNFVIEACAVTLLLFGSLAPVAGQKTKDGPSKELIDYVRDAAKLGLKDADIQQNALKAGWPADAVTESIAIVRSAPPAVTAESPAAAAKADPSAAAPGDANRDKPPVQALDKPQEAPAQPNRRDHGVPNDYLIGAGDVLQISVWDEPKASVNGTVVRPDGRVGMPLLKEVEVLGLTPAQAEKVITERLATLIPAADVTVVVTGIQSKKVYVVGAVKKEGPIAYTYRMTIMQAISEAGGLSDYAKRRKIYVLRAENGKEYRLPFNYDAVLKGEHMELNIPLLPNDTLVVPH